MRREKAEKLTATPTGPEGKPTKKDTIVKKAPIALEIMTSLPRPWLRRIQPATLEPGIAMATKVKPPTMAAALPHFGPSTARVNGWAKARTRAEIGRHVKAIAS